MGRLWVLLRSCLSLSESGHSELGADWIIIMTTRTHIHTLRESEQSSGNTDLLSRRYTHIRTQTVDGKGGGGDGQENAPFFAPERHPVANYGD